MSIAYLIGLVDKRTGTIKRVFVCSDEMPTTNWDVWPVIIAQVKAATYGEAAQRLRDWALRELDWIKPFVKGEL